MKLLLPSSVIFAISLITILKEQMPGLPARVQYVPDLVVAFVGSIVVARIVLLGRIGLLPLRYWLVFVGFLYVVVCGSILNHLSADVAVAGIRYYFKYVPLFLLPFAFDYSEKDIKRLFGVVTVLALVQVPVAFHQRFFEFATELSGDNVRGTTGSSGGLAVLGVALVLVVFALYLDSRISSIRAGTLGMLFLAPASLAEVKVVPIFFFFGVLAVLLSRRSRLGTSRIIGGACGAALLIGSFVLVYNALYAEARHGDYIELVASKDRALSHYMYKGMDALPFRTMSERKDLVAKPIRFRTDPRQVGRFDSLWLPFSALLPSEAMKLLVGVGIGNTFSTFGDGAQFLFVRDELGGGMTTVTQLIWETGIFGALFFVMTIALVGIDSLKVSVDKGFIGTVGAAWVGVITVVGVELIYHSMFGIPILASLFFLFSGIVTASRRAVAKRKTADGRLKPTFDSRAKFDRAGRVLASRGAQ